MKAQAWAWLTAGVLALGLNGIYQDVGAQWAHRIVREAAFHATAVFSPVSERVDEFLASVQSVAAYPETQDCRLAAAVARLRASAAKAHSGMARIEALSARQQAQCARLEANRARIEARVARVQFATMTLRPMEFNGPEIHVTCPRVRVVVPHLPIVTPVRVEMSGTGPV